MEADAERGARTRALYERLLAPVARQVDAKLADEAHSLPAQLRDMYDYAVGGGIESPFDFLGLFGPNWTSKSEYLYIDLGSTSGIIADPGGPAVSTTKVTEHIFRSGLNYHFNSPVVAKY